jgi:hypothetical protein
MLLDGLIQNFVMPRKQGSQGIGILLREFCTAFDIGEEKGDCA